MPNGFRPDVMLWRLVLRVDNVEDDSISLRVAARQARMEPGWPGSGEQSSARIETQTLQRKMVESRPGHGRSSFQPSP